MSDGFIVVIIIWHFGLGIMFSVIYEEYKYHITTRGRYLMLALVPVWLVCYWIILFIEWWFVKDD